MAFQVHQQSLKVLLFRNAVANTNDQTTVLVRTPAIKKSACQTTNALTESDSVSRSSTSSRVGHHNDCLLASVDDFGTYVDVAADKAYVAADTLYVPIGGETCAVNSPRSDCASALVELEQLHYTFLHAGMRE